MQTRSSPNEMHMRGLSGTALIALHTSSLVHWTKQWLPSPPTSMQALPIGQSFDVMQRLLHTGFARPPGT
jgi:hypothetical protein